MEDHGLGIDKREQIKIFERFERATPNNGAGGPGIGLFIAKQIMDAHHGTILVNSEPGKGSIFTVLIPLECNQKKY